MVERVERSQIFRGYTTSNGKPEIIYDIELIKVDLINHFYTRRGERVMDPEFGSIIWELIFDNFTDDFEEKVINDSRKIIESDPRLQLEDITIRTFEHGIVLELALFYQPFGLREPLSLTFDRRIAEQY